MNNSNNIPFLDLVSAHMDLRHELQCVFEEALTSAMFIGGEAVGGFEQEFAAFCGTEFCAGVSSGTAALRYALVAAGVQPGDSVITVPNTFIATAEAITQAGALPEFVDVDEGTYNMDPGRLREYLQRECDPEAITGRPISRRSRRPVTAVVPVHLYGQIADMDAIQEIAEASGLIVVEDACQAHGAEYFSRRDKTWKKAGSIGRAAAFSFYPGKNLGACGEGGAVVTNDERIIKKVKMIRDHGQTRKYYHEIEGDNGRLDAIQAGILRVKLRRLAEWNRQRREFAALYGDLLAPVKHEVVLPVEPSWSRSVYHLYVVQHKDRFGLQAHLSEKGIGSAIHYPITLHLQNAYRRLGYVEGDFPVSEKVSSQVLSLPMYAQLQLDQQHRVAKAVAEFVGVNIAPVALAAKAES